MARANPANKPQPNEANETEQNAPIIENSGEGATEQNAPIIEYFGEGAEDVKFNIEPNATRIRVYATGLILTDY